MATAVRHPVGADVSLMERHPALMSVAVLLCLLLAGGLGGHTIGRAPVLGVDALLGEAGQGM